MNLISSCIDSPVLDNCLFAPLRRQIGYIFHYKRNARNLKEKVEKLVAVKNDVNRSIDAAEQGGDLIKEEVQVWLKNVSTIDNEATELSNGVDEINSWFKGWCCSRYHLGKQAKKKIATVDELLGEGKNFSGVSVPALTPGIEAIPSGDFQDFSSRKSVSKEVIEALKNETFNVVGVCGMPGVGKTTLITEIGKKVKGHFDEVVMATVSHNPDLKKIQEEIAGNLGIQFKQENPSGRAAELSTRLKKKKRVLVILDDLWERLDLTKLGIPLGDDHKGCKVVLTTRSEEVCNHMESQKNIKLEVLSEQDSLNLFRQKAGDVVDSPDLQTLATEVVGECKGLPLAIATLGRAMRGKSQKFLWEAASRQLKQNIFNGMSPVFCSIKLSYDYLESEEIKKCFLYCCFFPEDYKISSTDLMPYVMGDELLENVYTLEEAGERLQTVFDNLIASCLLIKVREDENGFVTMMHDVVRDTAMSLIANEESNYGFIVKAGLRLERWPDARNLRTCIRMSLMRTQIDELPDDEPECPQLLSLSLSENYSLEKIPDMFFRRMTSLVTLDLRRTGISLLPASLSSLVNLQVLRLNNNNSLSDVSLVVNLKKLKILGLSSTSIKGLPEEIRELTNLRSLDLSWNSNLKIIPQNVLSNLTLLEELHMEKSFEGWEIDEMGDGSGKASLVEFASLNCLTKLSLSVGNVNCLSKDIPIRTEKLKDFDICACEKGYNGGFFKKGRKRMMLTTPSDPLSNWAKALLKRTDGLHLFDCRDLKNVVELDAGGFENLKYLSLSNCNSLNHLFPKELIRGLKQLRQLEVKYCDEMKEIVFVDDDDEVAIFNDVEEYKNMLPQLETLTLCELPKLSSFCKQGLLFDWPSLESLDIQRCPNLKRLPLGAQSAPQLKKFEGGGNVKWFEGLEWEEQSIKSRLRPLFYSNQDFIIEDMEDLKALCQAPLPNEFRMNVQEWPKMTNVVPGDLVKRLQNLQHIQVWNCKELTEIFHESERQVEGHVDMMASLKEMYLRSLPKLKTIWKVVTTSSTRLIRQSNSCDLATSFPPPPPPPLLIFPNLQILKISFCKSLNHLFPKELVRGLKQLRQLEVSYCNEMEEIIFVDDDDEVAIFNDVEEYKKMLPQLETLTLCELPKLSSFCKQGLLFDWPSLESLDIQRCPNLKRLPLGAQSAPQLKKFEGGNVKWFEGLEWEEQSIKSRLRPLFYSNSNQLLDEESDYGALQEFIIEDMKDLKALYQAPLPNGFKRMKVQKWPKMTNVIIVPGDLVERLQNLQYITVENCEELTEIFHESERQVEGHVDMMASLKEMRLWDLPKLKTIWKVVTTSSTRLIRQSNSCDLATSFPPPPPPPLLIFPNLQSLYISFCNSLNHLFPMELVRGLKQLRQLEVKYCDEMKEIVFVDDDEEEVAIFNDVEEYKKMLPQLETLTLNGLPKLLSFCKQGLLFDWPSLESLEIWRCPNLKRLPVGAQSAPQLKKFEGRGNVKWFEGLEWEEQSIKSRLRPLFYSNLPELIIEDMEDLKALCQGPLPNGLNRMKVQECPKMTNVVPGDLVKRLQNLQHIQVWNCKELTEIFHESERQVEGHVDMMASLKEMTLYSLPKLKTIWKVVTTSSTRLIRQSNSCDLSTSFPPPPPLPLLIFPNLQILNISFCNSLNHLFPMELVRGLKQLRQLEVKYCNEMKEIIFVDDDDDEVTINDVEEYKKMLPQLETLNLYELPKLSSFCKQGLLFDWPSLEHLDIQKCPNLKRLPLGAQSALQLKKFGGGNVKWFEGLEWEEQSIKSRLRPLFYSNQEFIIEDMEDLKALCQAPLPNGFKHMKVQKYPKMTNVVPGDLVERFQNLQRIEVENCEELTEIFHESERQVEGHVDMMAKLERMHLRHLPKLKTIWKVVTTSSTRLIRQSNSCDLATSFPPPPPPPLLIFPNLQSLYIWNCNSLNHLFPMKLVRGLKRLRHLNVEDCTEMEEIIFVDDDDEVAINDIEEYKKMLPQLETLTLRGLPKLLSFCKQGILFDWPSLESLDIQKCPNLKRLPLGAQSAPQLKEFSGGNVKWFEGLEWEEQSIKSRLRPLFYSSDEEFIIEDMEDLKALCQGPLSNGIHRMKVQKWPKMTNVNVPGELVERLQNLQEIVVYDCEELTEIFHESERQVEGHVDMMACLKEMGLYSLPKLKTIWKVVTTSSTRLIRQSNSCDLATSFPPPPPPPLLIFPNLQILYIRNCRSLNHLFPMKLVRGLKQLRRLHVKDCTEMEEIIFVDDDEEEVAINDIEEYKKMLPQLETLTLRGLPKLLSFCKQGILLDWPSLEVLKMRGCPNLKRLPLGAQSAPQLEKFKGDNVEWFEGLEWEEQSIKSRLRPLFHSYQLVDEESDNKDQHPSQDDNENQDPSSSQINSGDQHPSRDDNEDQDPNCSFELS